ncbi:MAG: hypothetical protein GWN62_25785, partial [Aliifodinibius sp.]|nr:hypothetical protein [Candidatus Saccharibacteria bacterium]NIV14558.1 hypothetical protein [Fodinibius sp.]
SKWLIATAVLQWLNGNLLIVSAGALLGTAAVGALKAAQNLMGVTHILFKGLDNIVPVRAAQHHRAGGTEDLMRYLTKTTLLGIGVTAA